MSNTLIGFLFGDRKQQQRARKKAAIDIDLQTGVLERCPVCRDIVDKQRDERLPLADQLAAEQIANHEPALATFNRDLTALRRLLREVRRDFPYHCNCEDTG